MGRVLIIDDDPDIIETMVSLLDGEGLEIKTLNNAKEALLILEKETFDTIISDISMPQMSGIQFLTELRKKDIQTPLIFVSGSDLSDDVKRALQLGSADFISKPFDIDLMIQKIKSSVGIGQEAEKLKTSEPNNQSEIENDLPNASGAIKDAA